SLLSVHPNRSERLGGETPNERIRIFKGFNEGRDGILRVGSGFTQCLRRCAAFFSVVGFELFHQVADVGAPTRRSEEHDAYHCQKVSHGSISPCIRRWICIEQKHARFDPEGTSADRIPLLFNPGRMKKGRSLVNRAASNRARGARSRRNWYRRGELRLSDATVALGLWRWAE